MRHLTVPRYLCLPLIVVMLFFLTAGCGQGESRSGEHAEVIVVGAGISGLSASLPLAEKGVDVLLLEKENRVGGKMYSISLGGVACNLGAQYIYSGGSPLIDSYMETLPLQSLEQIGVVWDGQYVGAGTEEEILRKLPLPQEAKNGLVAAFLQMSVDYGKIAKDRDFFFDIEPENPLWLELDQQSCQQYLSKYPPDVYKFIDAELGSEAGGSISGLAALLLVGWYGGESGLPRGLAEGGNQVLAERMRDDFLDAGGRLELDSEVTGVEQSGDSVTVTCRDGREYTAGYVIVATPVDAVKDIVKDLPASKSDALDAVEYGSIAVAGLHLEGLPPGEEVSGVLYVGESNIDGYVNQTGEVAGDPDAGTVISVIITDEAMLQLDDQALVQRVAQSLKIVSPGFDTETGILDYAVQRWPKGIVQYKPGYLTEFEEALRESIGRIYFAGDYASDPAIGGASWSGERAASGILDAMGK